MTSNCLKRRIMTKLGSLLLDYPSCYLMSVWNNLKVKSGLHLFFIQSHGNFELETSNGPFSTDMKQWLLKRHTKQDTRLPPGYFAPSNIVEMPFRRKKAFFFQKWTFPTLKFFWFLPKNLKNKVERHFQEKRPFETQSRKNLPHVAILKNFKVFFQNTCLIFQNSPSFERFENSFYSSRILRQICYNLVKKSFTFRCEQKCQCWRERHWQTSGKNEVRKNAFERKILLPYFLKGRKKNIHQYN